MFAFTLGAKKEEVNHNNKERKILLIPLTVDAREIIAKVGGGVVSLLDSVGQDDRFVPRDVVVGREVGSVRVRCRRHIGLVRRSGGKLGHVIFHAKPNKGRRVLFHWRCTMLVTEAEVKRGSW